VNRVDVYVDGLDEQPILAGVLEASFTGSGRSLASSSFQYDPKYLAHRSSYPLSPDLPLTSTRIYTAESASQFGAFADTSPDEWGRKIIDANHARQLKADPSLPRRLGPFDHLLGVSDRTRLGALRFRAPGTHMPWLSEDSGVANEHELHRVVEVARRYEANEATDEDLAYLSDIATSPGGARPKANVVTAAGTLAIAKLPHSKDGQIDVESWEALALTIAGRAGITVPQFQRIPAAPTKAVLVTERFDREDDGARIGYISAATAMSVGEHDGRNLTYVDFAEALSEISDNSVEDLRELYRRITLTVLINNVDDHWRNHGLLRAANGWRLAPAFDINPSKTHGVINSRPISSEDDPRDRDLRNLITAAPVFGLLPSDAEALIQRVATEVAAWRAVAVEMNIPDDQVEAMEDAFDAEQLEYALSLGSSTPAARTQPEDTGGEVWVPPHTRSGKPVVGHWRRRRGTNPRS